MTGGEKMTTAAVPPEAEMDLSLPHDGEVPNFEFAFNS